MTQPTLIPMDLPNGTDPFSITPHPYPPSTPFPHGSGLKPQSYPVWPAPSVPSLPSMPPPIPNLPAFPTSIPPTVYPDRTHSHQHSSGGADIHHPLTNRLCQDMEQARSAVQCRYLWRQALSELSYSALLRLHQVYQDCVRPSIRAKTFTQGLTETLFCALHHPMPAAHSLAFLHLLNLHIPHSLACGVFEVFLHHLKSKSVYPLLAPHLKNPTLKSPIQAVHLETIVMLIEQFKAGTLDPTLCEFLALCLSTHPQSKRLLEHSHAHAQALHLEQHLPCSKPSTGHIGSKRSKSKTTSTSKTKRL